MTASVVALIFSLLIAALALMYVLMDGARSERAWKALQVVLRFQDQTPLGVRADDAPAAEPGAEVKDVKSFPTESSS